MVKKRTKIPVKVEVHRNDDISIDGAYVPRTKIRETLEMYADPKFDLGFYPWCGLVYQSQVDQVKEMFREIIREKGNGHGKESVSGSVVQSRGV